MFTDDLRTAIRLSREAAGEKYVDVLGADVARQCLEIGELDEVLVFVAPVLLGGGTPLYRGTHQVDLTPVPGESALWFRVPKGEPA